MSRPNDRGRFRAGATPWLRLALVLVLTTGAATAEDEWIPNWPGPAPAPDSPYWWSAYPEVSAAALRAELLDREANKRRYQAAKKYHLTVSGNIEPEEVGLRHLVYVHSAHDPQLIPLWNSFELTAAMAQVGEPPWDPGQRLRALARSLSDAGMSEEGTAAVVEVVRRQQAEEAALDSHADAGIRRLERALWRAGFFLGEREATRAAYLGDEERLARYSFTPIEQIRRDLPILFGHTYAQAKLDRLVELKERLSDEDWEAFRSRMRLPLHNYLTVFEWRVPAPQPYFPLTHRLLPLSALLVVGIVLARRHRADG